MEMLNAVDIKTKAYVIDKSNGIVKYDIFAGRGCDLMCSHYVATKDRFLGEIEYLKNEFRFVDNFTPLLRELGVKLSFKPYKLAKNPTHYLFMDKLIITTPDNTSVNITEEVREYMKQLKGEYKKTPIGKHMLLLGFLIGRVLTVALS
jgi:hypothetical protein